MALPSPSSACETYSRLKEGKFQVADFSASMPSMISAGGGGEKVVLFEAVFAPLQQVAAAPQPQRDLVAFGVLLQHPQIELHQVPADDGVRIVALQPRV